MGRTGDIVGWDHRSVLYEEHACVDVSADKQLAQGSERPLELRLVDQGGSSHGHAAARSHARQVPSRIGQVMRR